jgi:hypothetical protein
MVKTERKSRRPSKLKGKTKTGAMTARKAQSDTNKIDLQ